MNKKYISFILAFIMLFSLFIPVSASQITNETTGNTTITYGMDEGFLVIIPGDFTIDSTAKATADIKAMNVMIAHGKVLEVAISGDDYVDSWELIDRAEASNKLTYTIGSTEGSTDIINNSVVLSVAAGTAYNSTVTKTMYFTVIDTLTKSGSYVDTLTFTVSINGGSNSTLYAATFADNSWSDIITAVQNDEVPSTWAVGDIKPMTINGTEYNIQIIGKDHDTYTSGDIAPLTFQLVECYFPDYPMNDEETNATGWSNSQIRTSVLPEILTKMPSEVQTAIKAVNKNTIQGYGKNPEAPTISETTSDKLFLLSDVEAFGYTQPDLVYDKEYSYNNGDKQYAYYANGGTLYKTIRGIDIDWWLRVPHYKYSSYFSMIDSNGLLNLNPADMYKGISFAFCF